MSTLTEIERAVELLPPREQEALFDYLAARIQRPAVPRKTYHTQPHSGGFRPGFDPAKLGQLPEEF